MYKTGYDKIEEPSVYWDPEREYNGMILLDQHCGTFGFKLDANIDPDDFYGEGSVCVIAGNIRKCLPISSYKELVSLEIIPENSTNLVAPYTGGDITLKYGLTQQLKAIAHYSDGSTKDVTNKYRTTWIYAGSSNPTAEIANVDNTNNKGLVTLIKKGTSKISASYTQNNKTVSDTATIKPDIWRKCGLSDFYCWDATSEENNKFMYNQGYIATHSCANALSYEDAANCLGNGVNLSENDGLIYTNEGSRFWVPVSNDILYCGGMWIKKKANRDPDVTPMSYVSLSTTPSLYHEGRPSNSDINQYFFLPAAGNRLYAAFIGGAPMSGTYWLSSVHNDVYANGLFFKLTDKEIRIVTDYNKEYGLTPLIESNFYDIP